MDGKHKLSRRNFLRVSAMTAASAAVAACGPAEGPESAVTAGPAGTTGAASAATTASEAAGAATTVSEEPAVAAEPAAATAMAASGIYQEAPMLAEMVKAGSLPPVAERLPKNPYVVPHAWVTTGKYGGTLRQVSDASWGLGHLWQESMYGHSVLRYLKDGLEVGPGLAESWEANADKTEWMFHFREGLKWSDGNPWTVDDILYWWEDMVLDENNPELPPDDLRSPVGTPAKLTKIDDVTLQLTFDVPSPVMDERAATWVKAGIGTRWMAPKHYLQQFDPKYNTAIKDYTEHSLKMDLAINPDCPTMTGWHLVKYVEAQQTVWERNPYYWCVDREGNQLPYIDRVSVTGVQDPETRKLQIQGGAADYIHGAFIPLSLSDAQGIEQTKDKHHLEMFTWDSGSGTGSIYFWNYDHIDPGLRALFRDPKFRQALSHAYNREEVRKNVYFNSGELTTGTLSAKGINFNINDQGKQLYQEWRDKFVKYDPELAKKLLDEIGVKEGAGGKRTRPDGSELKILIDYNAETGREHVAKNELLARDWQALGLDVTLNPVAPATFGPDWVAGKLQCKSDWEIGDNSIMLYAGWVVPVATDHWAPLHGQQYMLRGTPKEKEELDVDPWERTPPRIEAEEGGPIDRLWKLFDQARVEPDSMKRIQLEWEIMKVHMTDGPFLLGVVSNYPQLVLAHQDLKNVPRREDLAQNGWVNPWIHPTPAVYDPEAYYWENPEAHST